MKRRRPCEGGGRDRNDVVRGQSYLKLQEAREDFSLELRAWGGALGPADTLILDFRPPEL